MKARRFAEVTRPCRLLLIWPALAAWHCLSNSLTAGTSAITAIGSWLACSSNRAAATVMSSRPALPMYQTLLLLSLLAAALVFRAAAQAVEPVLAVAEGFQVERLYIVPRETQGSWVSLCADSRGGLYASDQYGPIYCIEMPAGAGEVRAEPLKLPIGGVHGLTWVGNDLYAVVGQREVCEPGLYRLRDADGDGKLDAVKLLRTLAGDGEHGPHAVAPSADGQSLYVIAGNATKLPPLARSFVPERWQADSLLPPLPALVGSETRGQPHGGWVCRTDREGREWELVAMGLRNAYGLAVNAADDVFTFDSDTEFELGLPWYRPTRVLHCASGADLGWRPGALKIPAGAGNSLPPLLPLGLGSPTAVLPARGAAFPPAYRDSLLVADWCFGRLLAVHLAPAGAGYIARGESLVSGTPLPITAACISPRDGAVYFVTGGRKTQSAIYRLTHRGTSVARQDPPTSVSQLANPTRRRLESYHGRTDDAAIAAAWPLLGSDDIWLRQAARIAVESQPLDAWQERALAERDPQTALTALVALSHAGDARLQPQLLEALEKFDWQSLGALRSQWLHAVWLALARFGPPPPDIKQRWSALLAPHFPTQDWQLDAPLAELAATLDTPGIAAKLVARLTAATPREQQIHYARCLAAVNTSWTAELRGEYFAWFAAAATWKGGASYRPFLERIGASALAAAPPAQRPSLAAQMAAAGPPAEPLANLLPGGRGLVREWQLSELVAAMDGPAARGDSDRGRRLFAAAGCAVCHTFQGEGGAVGSDLTNVAARMSMRELLEAIVEPSREISDQYAAVVVKRRDGSRVQGRVVNFASGAVHVCENLLNPAAVTKVPESEIEALERSKVSLMPSGLLNVLEASEIADLLAYLKSGRGGIERAREPADVP